MDPIRKILLISLLSLSIGLTSLPCQGQFFWLGFQAGEGVSWFSNPGQDNTQLVSRCRNKFRPSSSAMAPDLITSWHLSGFISTNQMKFEVRPGTTAHDNVPFHNFKIPLTAGYEIIHKPRFKWRVGGGMFIGTNTILSSNSFDFTQEDIQKPAIRIDR